MNMWNYSWRYKYKKWNVALRRIQFDFYCLSLGYISQNQNKYGQYSLHNLENREILSWCFTKPVVGGEEPTIGVEFSAHQIQPNLVLEGENESRSVVSDSLRPHGLYSAEGNVTPL